MSETECSRALSESMVQADFIWREIGVGDRVTVEHAYELGGRELLSPGRAYRVQAKPVTASGVQTLLVESNQADCLVTLYPHHVASYDASERMQLS